ncbi:MAG: hypothetical protein CO158_09560 [Piscirickettsiaceae bacterium CG_4_9_14_3_um_filter_43_564]|nr:MAG: hypothetical protein CO158_09560 [Piscirickettsiaceae bacterium CG_4_9_14_3_um_filter_43_564]
MQSLSNGKLTLATIIKSLNGLNHLIIGNLLKKVLKRPLHEVDPRIKRVKISHIFVLRPTYAKIS